MSMEKYSMLFFTINGGDNSRLFQKLVRTVLLMIAIFQGGCMKRTVLILTAFVFTVSAVYAANFSPTVMKLSAAKTILYNFDGKVLEMPVTISGKPASLTFLVYTKDQGNSIGVVQNGYLGWHYVNKIDTCIYMAAPVSFDAGKNTVRWNGKNNAGKAVPVGEYTYYMFAYDNQSAKIPATMQCNTSGLKGIQFQAYDEAGKPYAKPILYPLDLIIAKADTDLPIEYTRKKWVLGGDPFDATLLETTSYMCGNNGGNIVIKPDQQKVFFDMMAMGYPTPGIFRVRKYEWIPNGSAVQDVSWGDNGEYQFNCQLAWPHWESGVVTDGKGMLYLTNQDLSGVATESELIYVDLESGEEMRRVDLAKWWVDLADGEAGGQSNGGPTTITYNKGFIFTSSHTSCIKQMLDPFTDDDNEMVKWVNQNGDYVGDHNFASDAERPWVCNDYNVAPYMYTTSADDNQFTIFPVFDIGAVSFGLIGPDGTGINNLPYAGETALYKATSIFLDAGTPFDGIYSDNNSTAASDAEKAGIWFVANDSIKGVITNQVSVDEAPAAFSVAQNSPNPFNPTTTISFSIPEAGNVSIDVFNVAGQKVDTIASGFMSAGSHSVTWNADGFSAGVYFYSVKSGDLSRTMKMTLLK